MSARAKRPGTVRNHPVLKQNYGARGRKGKLSFFGTVEVLFLKRTHTRKIALCGVIAALYAAVTIQTAAISYGPVQVRIAEGLCLMPMLLPETVWGLALGCLMANLVAGVGTLDLVVGTAATLIAAALIRRCRQVWAAPLILAGVNGLLVGAMLAWVYTPEAFWVGFGSMAVSVAAGELIAGYLVGVPLFRAMKRITGKKNRRSSCDSDPGGT